MRNRTRFARSPIGRISGLLLGTLLAWSAFGHAAEVAMGVTKVELGGKIFINSLFGSDITQGSRYQQTGEAGGLNGTVSELELILRISVTEYITAGARIKNRYNENYWSTYWNNEDFEGSQYMKLRGAWVRFITPEWSHKVVKTVHIGSSDLGSFSPFTVGKIRYIDRDNASGVFLQGGPSRSFTYTLGRVALPSVWAGPGFSTEGRGFQDPFSVNDAGNALSMSFRLGPLVNLGVHGAYVLDLEGKRGSDDDTNTEHRYENSVAHIDLVASPTANISMRFQGAYSKYLYRDAINSNRRNANYNSVPLKDLNGGLGIGTFTFSDLGGSGLGITSEYFNIGDNFVSILAARREADALITEGFDADDVGWEAGGWSNGETQAPTMAVDSNDTQFDEQVSRSIIGWHGGTVLLKWAGEGVDLSAEYTAFTYNTNMQDRNVSVHFADNSGLGMPDNSYNWDQERFTQIAALRLRYHIDAYKGMDIGGRVKYIRDDDERDTSITSDDYRYQKLVSELYYQLYVADEIQMRVGGTYYDNRIFDRPTQYLPSEDFSYSKIRYFLGGEFHWKGLKIGLLAERFDGWYWYRYNKSLSHEIRPTEEFRSRAYLELSF